MGATCTKAEEDSEGFDEFAAPGDSIFATMEGHHPSERKKQKRFSFSFRGQQPTIVRDMPPPSSQQNHHHQQGSPAYNMATIAKIPPSPATANGSPRDGDQKQEEDPTPSPVQARTALKRQRRPSSSVGRSLQRITASVWKGPTSPARASNYNLVHRQVQINFGQAQRAADKSVPLGVVGFRNLGNTCFLNSSLQCLGATIPLTDYFLGYNYRSEINRHNALGTGGKLVAEYAELMKAMWLGKSSVIRPVSFKSQLERFAPQFRGSHQHDSQELLSFLLDGIHEDLNRIKKKPYIEDRDCDGRTDEQDAIEAWKNYLRRDKSLVVDIFQGQLRNTMQCLTCGHKNIRFEPFMYLSLPIADNCRTVTDCLNLYLQQEKMTGENQWYCEKCKQHRDATKKYDLWILPPILIVHLKRFKFNEYGHMGSKNNAPVKYPIAEWDLSKCVSSRGAERPLYDLYAVSNHVGDLGGGH
jgi:ubiquitin carboxyl-terminal hydrolase 8